jgi:anti-sigma-K factor RskA
MSEDQFRYDDAAYVLGALSPDERAAFEAHLSTCAQCSERVRELADLPALLATVRMDELTDELPDTLLPGLLRRAASEHRRRNWLTAGLAGLAAAALVALAVAVWPSGSSPRAHPQALTAVVASPIHATAVLASHTWGTEISLDCRYAGAEGPSGYSYALMVHSKDGKQQQIGTWTIAGADTKFTSGTSWPRSDIASIEIIGPGGNPILSLTT